MALSTHICTQLDLDSMAKHICVDPWKFNGIKIDNKICPSLSNDSCGFWFQSTMGDVGVSLDMLASSLYEAECHLETFLSQHLTPKWEVNEEKSVNYRDNPCVGLQKELDWKGIMSGGTRVIERVALNIPLIEHDQDCDGWSEEFRVEIPTKSKLSELRFYYSETNADCCYQIYPDRIIGCNFFFKKYKLKHRKGHDLFCCDPLDAHDNIWEKTIDVYREYNLDNCRSAKALYEIKDSCWENCDYKSDDCCFKIVDRDCSIVKVSPTYCKPSKYLFNYLSGYDRNKLGQMTNLWQQSLSLYALTLLPKPICPCDAHCGVNNMYSEWTATPRTPDSGFTSFEIQNNEFGTPTLASWRLFNSAKQKRICGY